MKSSVVHSSAKTGGSDNWCTPDSVLNPLRSTFGQIGLDPCTTESNPTKAKLFNTPERCGLSSDWSTPKSSWIFVNPPYSQIKAWVSKCVENFDASAKGTVGLFPSRTGTKWFQPVWETATLLFFFQGRLRFVDAVASAPFDSVLVYWGYEPQWFKQVCNENFNGHLVNTSGVDF